uniref:Uncharacterized protein n=1 Tax=Arundo donax TaxID=35708 RepID=A0A0A9A2I6_ARUDO
MGRTASPSQRPHRRRISAEGPETL